MATWRTVTKVYTPTGLARLLRKVAGATIEAHMPWRYTA